MNCDDLQAVFLPKEQQMHQILCSGVKRRRIWNRNSELPEDIIHNEILTRVPAISLVRFRLVCKSWNSLFSDSKFVKSHLTRQHFSKEQDLLICKKIKQDHGIIIVSPSHEFHIPAVPLLSDILLGSINGLVCMASRTEFCFWNPATGQLKEIYLPSQHAKNCKHLLGFSWDHVRDDYKVVGVCYSPSRSFRQMSIYSSNSDGWIERDIPGFVLPDSSIFVKSLTKVPSTIVKGLPYWSYSNIFLEDGTELRYTYISVFKFVSENNDFRLLPSLTIIGEKEFNFVNINDNLFGMAYKRRCLTSLVDIYSLNEESHSGVWSRIKTVGPISLCTPDWKLSQCFKNGFKVLIVRSGPLSYYDLKTEETKLVNSNPHLLNWCFNYTPSLVCVQGMVSMQEFFKDEVKEVKGLEVHGLDDWGWVVA